MALDVSELPAHQETGRYRGGHGRARFCVLQWGERDEACFLWKVLDKSDFPLVK